MRLLSLRVSLCTSENHLDHCTVRPWSWTSVDRLPVSMVELDKCGPTSCFHEDICFAVLLICVPLMYYVQIDTVGAKS